METFLKNTDSVFCFNKHIAVNVHLCVNDMCNGSFSLPYWGTLKQNPYARQLSHPALLEAHQGIPKAAERHHLFSVSWVCPDASSQLDMPSPPRCPGLIVSLNHLSWLLFVVDNYSTLLHEFLTLSPRKIPVEKVIFCCLYPRSKSFGLCPKLMDIDDGKDTGESTALLSWSTLS